MKLNIRKFDKWDDLIAEYNKNINSSNQQLQDLNNQKQVALDNYNANYNNQLNEYNNLMNQQQANIDTYKQTQNELLDKQNQRNMEMINQNRQETQENINQEKKNAYVDYMKQSNQYGGAAEQLASQGLATTGYAESSKIAMYNTYQNRVSAANTALTKANVEYDNQMKDAILNNDVAKAQIALDTLTKSYQLALQGFEYKNTLFNNKTNFELQVEDNYFNKGNTVQNRIDNYRSAIASIEQYKDKMAEEKRQFNQSLAATKNNQFVYSDTTQQATQQATQQQNTSFPDQTIIVVPTYTPKLSSKTADKWFDLISKQYSNNGAIKISLKTLDSLLNQGKKKGVLNEKDCKKIANYLGVDWK